MIFKQKNIIRRGFPDIVRYWTKQFVFVTKFEQLCTHTVCDIHYRILSITTITVAIKTRWLIQLNTIVKIFNHNKSDRFEIKNHKNVFDISRLRLDYSTQMDL